MTILEKARNELQPEYDQALQELKTLVMKGKGWEVERWLIANETKISYEVCGCKKPNGLKKWSKSKRAAHERAHHYLRMDFARSVREVIDKARLMKSVRDRLLADLHKPVRDTCLWVDGASKRNYANALANELLTEGTPGKAKFFQHSE